MSVIYSSWLNGVLRNQRKRILYLNGLSREELLITVLVQHSDNLAKKKSELEVKNVSL